MAKRFLYNHFFRYVLAIFPRLRYTEFGSAPDPEHLQDMRCCYLVQLVRSYILAQGLLTGPGRPQLLKIRTATARAHKKRLAIRVYTVYGITFDTDIITLARHGSRFHITHNNTPFAMNCQPCTG